MRSLFIGIFLSAFLAIIIGGHFIVYRTVEMFFPGVFLSVPKKWLLMAVLLLSTGFIFSSVSVHWYENIFTRAFYLLSGSWLGIFSNIFWTSLFLLIVYYSLSAFSVNLSWFRYLASCSYILAIIISFYGLWNAGHPVIKNIDIPIAGLPKQWAGKKIAQLSDIHLGVVHREDFLQKLIDQVNDQQVDMVVMTGDFFDGMDGRLEHLAEPLNRLKTPFGTYYVTGNHETYLGTAATNKTLDNESRARHLKNELITIDGLNILGVDCPEPGEKINVADIVDRLAIPGPTILLYHEPKFIATIASLDKIDLMLSGHTHLGQTWPYNFIARMVYGKYVYGLNTLGRLAQYTTTGAGTWGPPMRIGNRPEIPVFTLVPK